MFQYLFYNVIIKLSVCSSTFVSDEWRENLLAGLVPDLSIYNTKDYRRFLLAHLQFLNGLCQISIQTMTNSVDQFLSSTLSTTQLISEALFRLQIGSLIEQSLLDAPTIFNRILFLLRTINHGNAIVSVYGTNFEYIVPLIDPYESYAVLQAVIYDNECSCGLNATCTTQANFISSNSSEIIPVKGLKMGCTPSESLLASTLECFYDSSCIKLIQEQTNYNNSINTTILLSQNSSHFLINTTVRDLVNVLFVEDWSTQINYSSYFEQCSPSVCSYTYIQQFNLLYTITFLISIYGGLTIALKWICPWTVRLIANINQYRKKKSSTVQPVNTINTVSCHENVQRTSMNETNIPHMIVTTTSGKSTTSSVTTLPTSTVSTCQLMFDEPTSLSTTGGSDLNLYAFTVNDFNGDGLLDFATSYDNNYDNISVYVFLGNGDGTFRERIRSPTGIGMENYDFLGFLAAADFNNDGHQDLAAMNDESGSVGILVGDGNGSFETMQLLTSHNISGTGPLVGNYWLTVGDFNVDGHIDIGFIDLTSCNIGLFLGYGNGVFTTQITLSTRNDLCNSSFVIADFNGDGKQDIAVTIPTKFCVDVMFGYNNGSFEASLILSTGIYSYPSSVVANDFNRDRYLDIVVVNTGNHNIGVFLGNGDRSFQAQMIFTTTASYPPVSITAADFNGDGQLDITFTILQLVYGQYTHDFFSTKNFVYVMLGYGNGSFGELIEISTLILSPSYIGVGDFNGDGGFDLILLEDWGIKSIVLNASPCSIRNSSSRLYSSTTEFP
ncbi:unnamed protein product [Adineta steineri]|uniref:Uncharacterized protein n=1 Tax=Adineta steineri TaxID=433720 RepID=A0A815MNE5_9BILA|nr:unnamed protein product [Adineta steineri]